MTGYRLKKYFLENYAIGLIVLLSLVPIIRWASINPISERFSDLGSVTTSIGQILGLSGMMLFSINLILSNRNKFFDDIFVGMHHFYDAHKWIGSVSFTLLLFHPLLLLIRYLAISVPDAAFFILGNDISVTFGLISLLLMILLLSFTLYIQLQYHVWRFSHKFMVFAFGFALLHILLISSDISRDIFLRYYIFTFGFFGLISGFYRAFLKSFWNSDHNLVVTGVTQLNNDVTNIELEAKEKIDFEPGQFVFIRFLGGEITKEPHPFSISSAPGENKLKVTIKSLGDYTAKIKDLKVGTRAKIEGPFGKFYQRCPAKKEIWLAGGVGITPFLSMARSLGEREGEVHLYYSVKDKGEGVFLSELENISLENPKFKIFLWSTGEKGFITGKSVEEISRGINDAEIYLCGPLPFMKSLQKQFRSLGVDNINIHFEEFNFL